LEKAVLRREFIKGIVGYATACPLAAHAIQPAVPVVDFLSDLPAKKSDSQTSLGGYLHNCACQFRLETHGVADALREMELQEEPDLQKKRMLETMLEIARETPRREASFVERIGDFYQCPCCWIRYERHTNLVPLGGETEDCGQAGVKHFERYRCEACYPSYEYRISDSAQDHAKTQT
jgi:hypothetical protein